MRTRERTTENMGRTENKRNSAKDAIQSWCANRRGNRDNATILVIHFTGFSAAFLLCSRGCFSSEFLKVVILFGRRTYLYQ